MNSLSENSAPPIVELVIGAQFAPLEKLTIGHYGLFWKEIGTDEWVRPEQAPPLEDQFERFGRPVKFFRPEIGLQLNRGPFLGRFVVRNKSDDRLIQIQSTRFHLNWRKRATEYPSYATMFSEFASLFERFCQFIARIPIGEIAVNQWELTYVNAFRKGELWETPADWCRVLPGVFGRLESPERTVLEHRAAEWSYEITPQRGRLHVVAKPGKSPDRDAEALILQTTTRGPVGKDEASLQEGLDLGHEVATNFIQKVASPDVLQTLRKTI